MKLMLCVLLVVGVSTLVLAEVKEEVKAKVTEKKVETNGASDKSSDSKPKRDAPLLGSYHGPSYKYLPPSSGASSYDSYSHGHHGLASVGVGHSSGFGGGYSSSGIGHSSGFGGGYGGHSSAGIGGAYSGHSLGHHSGGHHGVSSSGLGYASAGHHSSGHHGGASSGLGYVSNGHHSGGHHGTSSSGLGYASIGHHGIESSGIGYASSGHGYSGHGLSHHSSGGIKGGSHGFSSGPSYTSTLGHGGYSGGPAHSAGPSYVSGHGYATSGSGSSGIGYKTHSVSVPSYALSSGHIGSSAGATTGYHYSKGISGSIPSASAGFGAGGFGSSHGIASAADVHHSDHSDHVHNGDQEHHYIASAGHSAGFGGSQGASSQGGYNYESPSTSYLPPVQQHALPASSYGVPIATVGEAYNTNYHSQSGGVQAQERGPIYAAGHKGLGHFGYTSSKPQALHTSITGSSFKQPSYSKAPFKPSTFLGSKYEGSAHNAATSQQYLPPSGEGADTSGYEYPIASGTSVLYQEPNYQANVDVQSTPIHEPESTYLPPNNNEVSYNEIPADPSASYLPPQQSYGVPYSH